MSISRNLILATLVGAVVAGSACTQEAADKAKQDSDTTLGATKDGIDKVLDATKEAGEKAGEATKDIAGKVADTSKEVASATGEAITDGWVTAKVSAKFVDETLLKGSDINVDTQNRVVTLKGTVRSDAAKARAAEIAGGTEGVTRVVNQIVVK